MTYRAPLKELTFCMKHHGGLEAIARLPAFDGLGVDTAQAVIEECGKFAETVLDPLNAPGDKVGATWKDGIVTTAPGFSDALAQFAAGGWQGLAHPEEYGGQALPKSISAACAEIINSANLSFALCPLLTDGAIEALLTAGSDELKSTWLPPMIEGRWSGTMNLTEPQAGSDLGLVRTRAERKEDGTYRVFGTKIFITYGEHDMTENIVHLVLARTAGAPEGVKGISLFVVPKFLVTAGGELGERNDVYCASIEHKLGIRASPTAVLKFGDNGGAVGYLVGAENRGLEYMFVMMNAARFGVGMQGVAIAERAYQKAAAYARERVQSRPVNSSTASSVTIIHHPDVRHMLMTMRGHVEAARALAFLAACAHDTAHGAADADERDESRALYEFLVPLVKGYATEISLVVTSLGVQVHGGMGYIEETGAAQYLRDARILPIYEGTTAIQANDFVGRKTLRDGGKTAKSVARKILETEQQLEEAGGETCASVAKCLRSARMAFEDVVDFMIANGKAQVNAVFAGSVNYLMLAATAIGGWQLARALLAVQADSQDAVFRQAKIATAWFYAEHMLSQLPAHRDAIVTGARSVLAIPVEAL